MDAREGKYGDSRVAQNDNFVVGIGLALGTWMPGKANTGIPLVAQNDSFVVGIGLGVGDVDAREGTTMWMPGRANTGILRVAQNDNFGAWIRVGRGLAMDDRGIFRRYAWSAGKGKVAAAQRVVAHDHGRMTMAEGAR